VAKLGRLMVVKPLPRRVIIGIEDVICMWVSCAPYGPESRVKRSRDDCVFEDYFGVVCKRRVASYVGNYDTDECTARE